MRRCARNVRGCAAARPARVSECQQRSVRLYGRPGPRVRETTLDGNSHQVAAAFSRVSISPTPWDTIEARIKSEVTYNGEFTTPEPHITKSGGGSGNQSVQICLSVCLTLSQNLRSARRAREILRNKSMRRRICCGQPSDLEQIIRECDQTTRKA